MKRRGLRVPFECITRADRLNARVAGQLAELGCYRVWIGSESGSQDVYKRQSTNLVMRLSVEELKLLRRAGLTQMSQGADTGSARMMHLMGKDFQTLDMIYGAAARLSAAGIRPSFNLIFGYPGEGEKERQESVAMMMKICRQYPGAEFWTNIFTPYPGSPIMKRAFELGIEVPKTLAGWADFFPRYTVLPWLKGCLLYTSDRYRIACDPPGGCQRVRSGRCLSER